MIGVPHGRRLVAGAAFALAFASLGAPARAGDDDDAAERAAAIELARSASRWFVPVEVALRFDEGRSPESIHYDYGHFVNQERTMDLAGVVLAADRVLVSDLELHPRFLASVTVVDGKERIPATSFAWGADVGGWLLALERPLAGRTAVTFDAKAPPPYRGVWHGKSEGAWHSTVGPVLRRVNVDEAGEVFTDSWSPAIVVGAGNAVAGVTLTERVALDGWQGSPLSWSWIPSEEREALVAKTKARAETGLVRVHLRLRSPKADAAKRGRFNFRFGNDDDDEKRLDRDVVGVLVAPRRVLVLESLDAKATARLESIEVHRAGGEPVPAKFACSYRHYGALLVETDVDLAEPLRLRTEPVRGLRDRFLLDARFEVQGEQRDLHVAHVRLGGFDEGWRGQIVPEARGSADHHFLFDRDGTLVALPVFRRLTVTERWNRAEAVLLPAEYLAPLVADPTAHADGANVPVSAERENRIAWLGVETQRLDRDLARANSVSHLTQDGETGALVSFVYAGSPASRAGIEPGAVILRLHVPDRPKPIEVSERDDPYASVRGMMESVEDLDERFREMMPGVLPWPSAESEINRQLTEVGFGKKVTVEYAVGGAAKKVEIVVEEAPVHHEAAPSRKSESLGTTVRDLTFEVRRYFQLEDTVTGVIVSKVERGSRAAVAGLRPFDIVLRVDDEPVSDVAAFEKATEKPGALRLGVKDRLKERIVKIAEAK